jgi:hypothetical protein
MLVGRCGQTRRQEMGEHLRPDEHGRGQRRENGLLDARLHGGRGMVVCVVAGLLASLMLAPAAFAAAPTYDLQGTWASGPLTNGTRDAANGTQVVTQMNMATGEFSGHSEVDGIQFELSGKESGTALEYTQTEGSYVAHDKVPTLSVLPDGNIGGNGSFEAGEFWMELTSSSTPAENETKEKQAKEKEAKEKVEKENARNVTVAVTCAINLDGSAPSTCTAQVGGANPSAVPTGTVRFSTTLGSFLGSDTCTLSRSSSGNTSFCAVEYAPPAGKSIIGTELPIKAAYSGDSSFNPGEGAFKLQETGIEATEFEDERINREACDALENTTLDVNEKTGEVTFPYTAPEPGTVQSSLEAIGSAAGGSIGLDLRAPLPQTPAIIADSEGGAPSSSISKECEAKLALALAGGQQASLSTARAQSAKKSKGRRKSKPKSKRMTIAKGNLKVKSAGAVKLHIHLNKAGKKLIAQMKRKHARAHVAIRLRFKR